MMRRLALCALVWVGGCDDTNGGPGAGTAGPDSPTTTTSRAIPTASAEQRPEPARSTPEPDIPSAPSAAATASASARSGLFTPGAPAPKPGSLGTARAAGSGRAPGYGCPCGCDHSKEMAHDLALRDQNERATQIDRSVATIEEREDAGYITEAMAAHRLRLLTLGHTVDDTPTRARRPVPAVTGDRTTGDSLDVRVELVVHGEHTEHVDGRDKLLASCFLLRLHVENTSGEPIAITAPTIDAHVAFPVSRWYLAGTDGTPWSGTLAPAESETVYVIGYTGDTVLPGEAVQATIALGSLRIPVQTVARARWWEAT